MAAVAEVVNEDLDEEHQRHERFLRKYGKIEDVGELSSKDVSCFLDILQGESDS